MKQTLRHFIDLDKIPDKDLKSIIESAKKLKSYSREETSKLLALKNLAMIFEKPSTRTRVSFEAGINQLGGSAITMGMNETQLSKGESIADTARVLSRFVDLIMIRCKEHDLLSEMAKYATCPVINGLSDYSHPCQIMASILTIEEKLGNIKNKKLTWIGDANNVLNSYIHAALPFGYKLVICTPKTFDFCDQEIRKAQAKGAKIELINQPNRAARKADVIITDTWISMGQNLEAKEQLHKLKLLASYQVNQTIMSLAKKHAIFTHCLPACRGQEVTEDVIDGPNSVVFEEAANRLHVQKAIMLWLMRVKI